MTTPSTQDGGTTNELSSLGLAIPAAAAASKYYLIKINLSPTLFAPHHTFFSTREGIQKLRRQNFSHLPIPGRRF